MTTSLAFVIMPRVSARRHRSIPSQRTTAPELSKSIEQRVARIELRLKDLQQAFDVQAKRTTALQAHLDHLTAKFGR